MESQAPTPDQVESVASLLRATSSALSSAAVPEAVQEVAFGKAFDVLARRLIRPGLQGPPDEPIEIASSAPDMGADDPLRKVASKLGLEREQLQYVYDVEDGQVLLAVAPSKLSSSKAQAMRDVALLLSVGRQASGNEERTPFEPIRQQCADMGVFHTDHFAGQVAKLGDADLATFKGKGRSRELRVTGRGYEAARELILGLSGERS